MSEIREWSTSGTRISGQSVAKEKLLQVIDQKGAAVAFVVYSDLTDKDHVESHADQRLLAASPDMLRALIRAERKLSAYVGVCTGDKELTDTVLPMIRAAMFKAEGK